MCDVSKWDVWTRPTAPGSPVHSRACCYCLCKVYLFSAQFPHRFLDSLVSIHLTVTCLRANWRLSIKYAGVYGMSI